MRASTNKFTGQFELHPSACDVPNWKLFHKKQPSFQILSFFYFRICVVLDSSKIPYLYDYLSLSFIPIPSLKTFPFHFSLLILPLLSPLFLPIIPPPPPSSLRPQFPLLHVSFKYVAGDHPRDPSLFNASHQPLGSFTRIDKISPAEKLSSSGACA